jgi:hypothetical protein
MVTGTAAQHTRQADHALGSPTKLKRKNWTMRREEKGMAPSLSL